MEKARRARYKSKGKGIKDRQRTRAKEGYRKVGRRR